MTNQRLSQVWDRIHRFREVTPATVEVAFGWLVRQQWFLKDVAVFATEGGTIVFEYDDEGFNYEMRISPNE